MQDTPQITCFLIKIASRCNLACDYCYMYRHADQTWREKPWIMSANHRKLLSLRIAEYVEAEQLKEIVIVLHGGEPLLAGIETIIETKEWIRDAVPNFCKVDFSIQTNGILLSKTVLDLLKFHNVGVSLSIDGPKESHDRHRLDHKGRSSFEAVKNSLTTLMGYPSIYSGLIAVIDPFVDPLSLFEFFESYNPPQLDFLLPDANHNQEPAGREQDPNLYSSWLIKAFDIWFDKYPHIPVRTFDALLKSIVGLPSNTDSFGFGDVSLLTIETDGTYHDLDVLKITTEGMTSLDKRLEDYDISTVVSSSIQIQSHRKYLTFEGLSKKCKECSVVSICGGGSVPHRFADDGFNHSTVYCHEMMALINHARERLVNQVKTENANQKGRIKIGIESVGKMIHRIADFERPMASNLIIREILNVWMESATQELRCAINWALTEGCEQEVVRKLEDEIDRFPRISIFPSVVAWVSAVQRKSEGMKIYSIDGYELPIDPFYPNQILNLLSELFNDSPLNHLVHRNDPYLRLPFGSKILFEDGFHLEEGKEIFQESMSIIKAWCPSLIEEMRLISPEIQFIKDLTAHPDKIVSFSDDAVPGALYVSIRQGERMISPYDLADSLIHEHRHQKLYLLQSLIPLVIKDSPLVPSPWRDDLRPPSGLLHAVFVFTPLLEFWVSIFQDEVSGIGFINKDKARENVRIIKSRLTEAFLTLKNTKLTETGSSLVAQLEKVVAEIEKSEIYLPE
jgi:uncharacterized protein